MSTLHAVISALLVVGFLFWPAAAILAVIVFVYWLAYSIGHSAGYEMGKRRGWKNCVQQIDEFKRAGRES